MNEKALDSTNSIEEINLKKEQLAEVDKSILEQKSKIEFAEAIKRLKSNPDYQLVILYFFYMQRPSLGKYRSRQ